MCEGCTCDVALLAFPIFVVSLFVVGPFFKGKATDDEATAAGAMICLIAAAAACIILYCIMEENKRKKMEAEVDRVRR